MDRLNYHHLRYFHEVAREGNLTRVAARLNVSQSALSTQIRQLEDRLGHRLFEREGRSLILTEAGQLVLDHADRIFHAGKELVTALGPGDGQNRALKIGALSTLSRNFQLQFLRPILDDEGTALSLVSGDAGTLLEKLQQLDLDLVLSTEPPARTQFTDMVAHRIAEQPVSLYGVRERMNHNSLRDLLEGEPIVLPTESSIRTGFDSLAARLGVRVRLAAEVDDMAMVRLLAREGVGLAVVPEVVLADEVRQGVLVPAPFPLDIRETFYAISPNRRFHHPALARLLSGIQPLPL